MDKKIVVPQGMLEATVDAFMVDWERGMAVEGYWRATYTKALTAALLWLSENPIVPTQEQILDSYHECNGGFGVQAGDFESAYRTGYLHGADWVQRRMFLAPEPEVPYELKDLLYLEDFGDGDKINAAILEAYRRGVEAGKQ